MVLSSFLPQLNLQQTAATTMVSASQSATKAANKAKAASLSYARLAEAQRNLTVHLKTRQVLPTTDTAATAAPTATNATNATTAASSRVLNTMFQEEDATTAHRFEQQLHVLLDLASTGMSRAKVGSKASLKLLRRVQATSLARHLQGRATSRIESDQWMELGEKRPQKALGYVQKTITQTLVRLTLIYSIRQ